MAPDRFREGGMTADKELRRDPGWRRRDTADTIFKGSTGRPDAGRARPIRNPYIARRSSVKAAANSPSMDELRMRYGFWIVIAGLVVVGAVFVAAVLKWTTAADVSTAVGSLTGVVGTIIGAFFGVQVGSAGKEKAEAERVAMENKALSLAAELPPDRAKKILGLQ
jgi:hypothetical protein